MKKASELVEGDFISILVGHSTGHVAIAVRMTHADIIAVSEKAIKLSAKPIGKKEPVYCWVPRKALVKPFGDNIFELATWLDTSGWVGTFFEITSDVNVNVG